MPGKPTGSGVESTPKGTSGEGEAGVMSGIDDPSTLPGEDGAWSCTASESTTCSNSVRAVDVPGIESNGCCPESKDSASSRSKEDLDAELLGEATPGLAPGSHVTPGSEGYPTSAVNR
jgi:hypothetical protein